jgi:hypothetical protein
LSLQPSTLVLRAEALRQDNRCENA